MDIGKKEKDIIKSNMLGSLWQFEVKFILTEKYVYTAVYGVDTI